MKSLITGGAGFIGSYLAEVLLSLELEFEAVGMHT
jgi:nucleoside-diphosphate-sugar epimerase